MTRIDPLRPAARLRGLVRTVADTARGAATTAPASADAETPDAVRERLRRSGVSVHESTTVHPTARVQPGAVIGARGWVNADVRIDRYVTIGDDVALAPGVRLECHTHEIGPSRHRAGATLRQPVTIEDGCWIGLGALVLPGVTVARGCVVAAGAVVAKDTEPDGVYGGVPAKRLKDLSVEGAETGEGTDRL